MGGWWWLRVRYKSDRSGEVYTASTIAAKLPRLSPLTTSTVFTDPTCSSTHSGGNDSLVYVLRMRSFCGKGASGAGDEFARGGEL